MWEEVVITVRVNAVAGDPGSGIFPAPQSWACMTRSHKAKVRSGKHRAALAPTGEQGPAAARYWRSSHRGRKSPDLQRSVCVFLVGGFTDPVFSSHQLVFHSLPLLYFPQPQNRGPAGKLWWNTHGRPAQHSSWGVCSHAIASCFTRCMEGRNQPAFTSCLLNPSRPFMPPLWCCRDLTCPTEPQLVSSFPSCFSLSLSPCH